MAWHYNKQVIQRPWYVWLIVHIAIGSVFFLALLGAFVGGLHVTARYLGHDGIKTACRGCEVPYNESNQRDVYKLQPTVSGESLQFGQSPALAFRICARVEGGDCGGELVVLE